jgi:hypothetical protein
MKTFKEIVLQEALKTIIWGNKELKWNPNKTEKEFKERIKKRTNLQEEVFYRTIQDGLNSISLPMNTDISVYFIKSKFVLILDTKNLIIKTIRDGSWNKPGNNCSELKIANEMVVLMQDDEINYINENKFFKIKELSENFDIILESTCKKCFSTNF